MTTPLYPSSLSPAFRRQVTLVMGAILLFIIVYLLLVTAAIALALACGYLGIALILHMTNFLFLIIGVGIIGVGISVIGFLVKFIFTVAKDDNSSRVEITEAQHPRLFAFIRRLAAETHTPFPKKIFLSPDVNAAVFYNSSFWSMFLPVRKNLVIGLGLVNSVNISEFKAVIAHEFGHFSQKSMRLGAYTYNVNRVIHNMLFDNKDYTAFLRAWGSIHSYLRFFVGITVKIAAGIQWVLRKVYTVINKTYLGLSREMEFHADTVAAGVSGSNNCISALSRIEVASSCYNTALNDASEQLQHKKITRNIYPNQLTVLRVLAEEYQLPVRDGLPDISFHFIESFSRSRINYKDQWASHPTLQERKASLDRLGISVAPDTTLPWQLFDHAEALQETLTAYIYRETTLEASAVPYDAADFQRRYLQRKRDFSLPAVYKGFYTGRYIEIKDWDIDALAAGPTPAGHDPASTGAPPIPATPAQLFNEDNSQLQTSLASNEKDLETLKAIRDKKIGAGSFDFDGVKHKIGDCDRLITRLQEEIRLQHLRQQELDKAAFLFFLNDRDMDKDRLKAGYRWFKKANLRYESYTALVKRLLARLHPLYTAGLTLGQVNQIISQLKTGEEAELKKTLQQLLDDGLITPREEVNNFLAKKYLYFVNGHFFNTELNELTGLALRIADDLNRHQYEAYKAILEFQATALEPPLPATAHKPTTPVTTPKPAAPAPPPASA